MADNKLLSLNELFSEKLFRIPDFQRGYSWGKNQLEDFWNDLINLKEGKVHYTGLLTIEPITKNKIENSELWKNDLWLIESGFKAYYLIDGQQRLTTSIILINEILNIYIDEDILFKPKSIWIDKFLFQSYKNSYKSYIFGYEKDNPSDEFFKTKILNQESSFSDKVSDQTLYTSNLEFAKKFFQGKLSQLEATQQEKIFKKVITSFKFNFYEIDDNLDVYVTFETMNNRGKPLSNLELLKNRLIYLATMLDDEKQITGLRKDINESWKTIYEYLGKNKESKLEDDDFLRDHWVMYFKYNRSESESYAKYLLTEKFTTRNILENQIGFEDIRRYVNSLQKIVKYWFWIHNPSFSNYNEETKEWLSKLNRLNMGAFAPLLIAVTSKSNEQEFLPLLKSAERFIFLVFHISQRKSNTANSTIYRYAHDYYLDNLSLEEIKDKIDYLTDGKYENDAGEEVYTGWLWLYTFTEHINELYHKKEGFYSWSGLRYFLYEYELFLQKEAKGDEKVSWNDFSKRKKDETIEHIYPQTADNPYWEEFVNSSTKSKIEKDRLLHSIGNLLLLSRSKNSELQNYDFPFKKKHINKQGNNTGFFNGSYSEIKVSEQENWTAEAIKERSEKMLAFMDKRWNIDFKSWVDFNVDKILGLDFVNFSKSK